MSKTNGVTSSLTVLLLICLFAILPASSLAGTLVGSLEGEINVNQGKLEWGMPFEVPAGPNGIAPELGLSYVPGNSNGILGLGFQFSGLSSITRCPAQKEYDGYDGGFRYDGKLFCLDGQRLLLAGDGTGTFRTAIESFSKVEASGDGWTVYTKDGYILDYGQNADSRISSPVNNAVIAWRLNRKRDRFGNAVTYQYRAQVGNNATELGSIRWSIHELKINYQERADTFEAWQGGDKKSLTQRVHSVEVFTNDKLLRRYEIGYGRVGAAGFSRLQQIALCDRDNNCTPPTTFKWDAGDKPDIAKEKDVWAVKNFATYVTGDLDQDGRTDVCYLANGLHCQVGNETWHAMMELPEYYGIRASYNHQDSASSLTLLDLNNDTYPDYCIQGASDLRCGLNTGHGFAQSRAWSDAWPDSRWPNASGLSRQYALRFIDLNGDHLPDVCRIASSNVQCAYNLNGTTFSGPETLLNQSWPMKSVTDPNVENATVGFLDINGDGLADLCGATEEGYKCALRDDTAWKHPRFLAPVLYGTTFGAQWDVKQFAQTFRYGDLNADGLVDACWRAGNEYRCSINNGKKWLAVTTWGSTAGWAEDNLAHATLQLHDMDSDGRADLCVGTPTFEWRCGRNTGAGFAPLQEYTPLRYGSEIVELAGAEKALPLAFPIRLADMNNDGTADICYRGHSAITCGLAPSIEHSLLSSVTTGYGNTTDITYGFLTDPNVYTKESSSPNLRSVQPNQRVVRRIATSDGVGGMKATRYSYSGLKYATDEGESRGFHFITAYDETSKRETTTEYFQGEHLQGRVKEVVSSIEGSPVQSASSRYIVIPGTDRTGSKTGGKTILPSQTVENRYDAGILLTTQTTDYGNYDDYGNAQRVTVTSQTSDYSDWNTKETSTTFLNDPYNWLLGKPETVTVKHSNAEGSWSRQTDFTYYISPGAESTGAVKTETIQPGGALELVSEFEYDDFGNKVKTTIHGRDENNQDVLPRTSTARYYAGGLYIKEQKNAKGHKENFVPDPWCGAPQSQTGPNGLTTYWEYDSLCQKIKETRPDGTYTVWNRTWSKPDGIPYGPEDYSVYKVTENSSGAAPKTVWYDSLSREVRTATKGFNGEDIYQDKIYNRRGLLVRASLPYEPVNFPSDTSYWVRSEYDLQGRITAEYKPNGNGAAFVTRYDYKGLTTTVTDPNDHFKKTTVGVLGKPLRVKDGDGETTINYTYNALGDLLSTNVNGQVTEMRYNNRGFKVSMDDPAMGEWKYSYNPYGELVAQRDANGNVTTMEYDKLGRMTKRLTAEGESTWRYDTANASTDEADEPGSDGSGERSIGKLVEESNGDTSTSYSYDDLGRLTSTTRIIDGRTYTSFVEYGKYSRPAQETYPDGVVINRRYTATGYLQRITTPKANVWDYDYGILEQRLASLGEALARAVTARNNHQDKAQEALDKAAEFTLNAADWESRGEELQQEADELKDFAKALEETANDHLRDARQYSALVADYMQTYKGLLFQFEGTANGAANYGAYDIDLDVPLAALPKACLMYTGPFPSEDTGGMILNSKGTWDRALWCGLGPARNADLASLYTKYAQILRDEGYTGKALALPPPPPRGSEDEPPTIYNPLTALDGETAKAVTNAALAKVCLNQASDYTNPKANEYKYYNYYQWAVNALPTVLHGKCTTGLDNTSAKVSLSAVYDLAATAFREYAAVEREDAALIRAAAAEQQANADNLLEKAGYFEEKANAQYAEAKEQANLLLPLLAKIADYLNAQDEIERALDSEDTDNGQVLLWAATSTDAAGRIQGELAGNGHLTRREYDPYSGQLARITTGIQGEGPLLRDISYTYDGANNVLSRDDAISGLYDTYRYDAHDRLIHAGRNTSDTATGGGFQHNYGYDSHGNLENMPGSGSLETNPANNRLRTLTRYNGNQKSYAYDANGNMRIAGDNTIRWSSFNQPLEITNSKSNTTATFLYDANQQRVQQYTGTDGKSELTTYVSKAYEVSHNDLGTERITQRKHYIYAGDRVVAIHVRTAKGNGDATPDELRYLHADALGNVDTITNSRGKVIQRMSYEPFGERSITRNLASNPDAAAWTERGFTGHEHLDGLGLIHMGARLYDPAIGRFLSPDTYIQAPANSQNYNRYTYVMNNPLKYTDPSGHFWMIVAAFFLTAAALMTDISILDTIAVIAFAAVLPGTFGVVGAMLKGAAAGFVSGIVTGTNPFKAALWGAITAGAAWGVGHGIGGGLWKDGHGVFSEGSIGRNLVHGVTQGTIAELRGGNFKSGFVGAIAGETAGQMARSAMVGITGTDTTAVMQRTAIAAVFGGLAAEATGGSFEDGAMSAAFTHLFNTEPEWWLKEHPGYQSTNSLEYPGNPKVGWSKMFDKMTNSDRRLPTPQEKAQFLAAYSAVLGIYGAVLLSGPEGWCAMAGPLGEASLATAGGALYYDQSTDNLAGFASGLMGKGLGLLYGPMAENILGGYATLYGSVDLARQKPTSSPLWN